MPPHKTHKGDTTMQAPKINTQNQQTNNTKNQKTKPNPQETKRYQKPDFKKSESTD